MEVHDLGNAGDRIDHVTMQFGFQDDQDVPATLRHAHAAGFIEVDPDEATYFVSRITLQKGTDRALSRARRRLFIAMANNAAIPTTYFRLPTDRVVVMGAQIRV